MHSFLAVAYGCGLYLQIFEFGAIIAFWDHDDRFCVLCSVFLAGGWLLR